MAPSECVSRLASIELQIAAAAVFFLPINIMRLDIAYFTLSDLLCLVSVALRLRCGTLPIRPVGSATPLWAGGTLALAFGLLASSLVNGDMVRGVVVSFQYLFSFLLLPLVIFGRTWQGTALLVKTFAFSIFLAGLFGIYLIHIDGERNTAFVSGNGRLMSFVERENACASLFAMTTPLMLWLRAARRLSLVGAVVGVAMLIYGTLLTGSNTGLIALCAALAAFFLLNASAGRMIVGTAAAAVLLGTLFTAGQQYLPEIFQRRVLAAIEDGDLSEAGTFDHRLALMTESLEVARRTMLFGLGADRYREESWWGAPVHNTYLLIWTEGGLIALAGFVATLIAAWAVVVAALARPQGRIHGSPLLCILVTFALLINAAPHVYARFWIAPLMLAAAVASCFLRYGAAPSARARRAGGSRAGGFPGRSSPALSGAR